MKRHLFTLVSATGLAILAACSSSVQDDSESGTGAISADKLDDSFATAILAGGCKVTVDGSEGQTAGSGGACPTQFSKIFDVMEASNQAKVFVVSEKGDRPNDSDTKHRFVVSATNGANPFFIATVTKGGVADEGGTEAIGFSPSLQAFAYYRVEGSTWVRMGDGTQVKTMTKGTDQPFECIGCHSTGAPLMKEIHDSWGNWTSTWDRIQAPPSPNALFSRLFGKVQRADDLENVIIDGIKRHSKGRVDRAKQAGQLKGVLTQLMCEVGEPSLVGAHSKSGGRLGNKISTGSQMLPGAIMFNQLFVKPATGGTVTELGFEQSLNLSVPSAGSLKVDPAAYADAISKNGQKIGGQEGDTIFPMSSPEKSHADLDAVQELLRQNLIDKEIVADILMTDYTVSAFSQIRCDLADTLPDNWSNAADLKKQWAAKLGSSPARGAKGLAARLGKDDITAHAAKLEAYAAACKSRPAAEFTPDVVKIMSQRRVEFAARYRSVIESTWLIPTDNLSSKSGTIRFSKDCKIEKASEKFDGED